MRLGVVTSHPIQYQAPWFRALAKRIDLAVYFAHRATGQDQATAGFGVSFDWDTDLTSGYDHRFLQNVSSSPGIVRFGGCDTPSIPEVLAADRIDVVAVNGWHLKSYLQAARAARSLRIPVMARTDSHLDTPRPALTRAVKAITHPLFLRQFDMFLPAGDRAAQYLRRYGVPESRIRVVPYCIDVEAFRSAADHGRNKRDRLRAELGVLDGEKLVVFVGKLIAAKGIPILIEALAQLSAAGRALRLVVAGSGPLAGELAEMTKARALPATFIGFVNQTRLPEIYAAADVLALPSCSETWGLVVNEAFACGLPAIVSDRVGCAPDMITDGVTGTVFQAGNVGQLADAIDYWTSGYDNRATCRAHDECSRRYSPASAAQALVDAAQSAAARQRKAAR